MKTNTTTAPQGLRNLAKFLSKKADVYHHGVLLQAYEFDFTVRVVKLQDPLPGQPSKVWRLFVGEIEINELNLTNGHGVRIIDTAGAGYWC